MRKFIKNALHPRLRFRALSHIHSRTVIKWAYKLFATVLLAIKNKIELMKCVLYNSARLWNDIILYEYQREIQYFLFEKKIVSICQVDKSVWPTEQNTDSLFYIENSFRKDKKIKK